jgi:hypothetical protein
MYVGNMGFTPNKSAFELEKMPEVEIPLVDRIKENNIKSKRAGLQAAQMKKELEDAKNKCHYAKLKRDCSPARNYSGTSQRPLAIKEELSTR